MELNLDKIQAQFTSLQAQKEESLRTRFRFEATPEEVAAHLRRFYLLEVEKRGVALPALDEFTDAKIASVSRWLTVGKKPGLFLCGNIGTGKTTMARAVVGLINAAGWSAYASDRKCVMSVTAKELAEMKSADTTAVSSNPDAFFDSRKRAGMLFIDDLGTERTVTKSWGNEQTPVVDLLFYRYDRQLFTIITSNLDSPDTICEKYGPRVTDRMNEMFDFINYNNKASYRKR